MAKNLIDDFEIPISLANHYYLRKHQLTQFHSDYILWKKLLVMPEYHIHDAFHAFVQHLEAKLYNDCFSTSTEEDPDDN